MIDRYHQDSYRETYDDEAADKRDAAMTVAAERLADELDARLGHPAGVGHLRSAMATFIEEIIAAAEEDTIWEMVGMA